MKDTDTDPRRPNDRGISSSWITMALAAVAFLYLFVVTVVDVVLDADRNPYWRATCAVLAPFVAYAAFRNARDAIRLRRRR